MMQSIAKLDVLSVMRYLNGKAPMYLGTVQFAYIPPWLLTLNVGRVGDERAGRREGVLGRLQAAQAGGDKPLICTLCAHAGRKRQTREGRQAIHA